MTADDGATLVPTDEAALALGIEPDTLDRMAVSRLITPARTDDRGEQWWNLHDLRRQLVAYLDDRCEE